MRIRSVCLAFFALLEATVCRADNINFYALLSSGEASTVGIHFSPLGTGSRKGFRFNIEGTGRNYYEATEKRKAVVNSGIAIGISDILADITEEVVLESSTVVGYADHEKSEGSTNFGYAYMDFRQALLCRILADK